MILLGSVRRPQLEWMLQRHLLNGQLRNEYVWLLSHFQKQQLAIRYTYIGFYTCKESALKFNSFQNIGRSDHLTFSNMLNLFFAQLPY